MATIQDNPTQETGEYRVVGTRPIRHDGPDKVTGRARYAADVHPPGFLHGKVLRSPHPHAVIKNIDTSRAQALPGVRAVATSADVPDVSAEVADQEEGGTVNYGFYSRNVMAREKALYRGHAVAAVAATSAGAAEQALALIDVDYEVLPQVLNAEEAMRDGAAVLHDRLLTLSDPNLRQGGYGNREGGSNVANRFEFRWETPTKASAKPTWWWNGSFTPGRCIKATSSPTRRRRCGPPMETSRSGVAARAISPSETTLPLSWASTCPRSRLSRWRSAAVSAGRDRAAATWSR